MKLTLIVIIGCLAFLAKGVRSPYYFALGYLWLSLLYPQSFTSPFFSVIPWNLVFGVLTFAGAFLFPSGRRFYASPTFLCIAAFLVWVTFTTTMALLPPEAWVKWRWATPSILMGLLMPLVFRNRREIESAVAATFFALMPHILTAGVKTVFGGGGYKSLRTLMYTPYYMGETSTLATVAVVLIPLGYYLARHSLAARICPRLSVIGSAGFSLLAMIGTSARAGLVALAALLVLGVRGMRFKALAMVAVLFAGAIAYPLLSGEWMERMRTIETYDEDASAQGRLEVWRWTFDFVRAHPLGGGFEMFKLSSTIPDSTGRPLSATTAFHSIYFEVLGEHGFVGFALYLTLAISATVGFYRASRRKDLPDDLLWVRPFATSMFAAIVPFLVGGAFIGVAFQPFGYTLFGIYLCMLQALRQNPVRAAAGNGVVLPTHSSSPRLAPAAWQPSFKR